MIVELKRSSNKQIQKIDLMEIDIENKNMHNDHLPNKLTRQKEAIKLIKSYYKEEREWQCKLDKNLKIKDIDIDALKKKSLQIIL